ncbi:MAG TPA: hypothetical protein PKW37_00415 [Salinivirgaceae bacterium]|nr:hypothetical protein [Salinivirgaceae bacterium]
MIYVDCDDVISESTSSYIEIIKREFGIDKCFEDIKSFDLKKSFGLTEEQYKLFFDIIHSHEELMKFKPVEGAIETMHEWAKKGNKIGIVTGRLTTAYDSTIEWLANYKVPYDYFIIVDKYNRTDIDKTIAKPLEYLRSLKIDFAIEDSLSTANYLAECPNVKVALMDRPWNRDDYINKNIVRVFNWKEIKELYNNLQL